MRILKFLILICLLLFLACATTGKLMKLELEMTKKEVVGAMGNPHTVRGSITNKYGQVIEVWEYGLYKPVGYYEPTYYWLFFCEGKLVQWGEAGDWQKVADQIYEIRFK